MDSIEQIISPALPDPIPWGWPEPIWWVLFTGLVVLLSVWRSRRRQRLRYQAPLRALIEGLDDTEAVLIASRVKAVLLAYFSRQQVASLSAGEALNFLQHQWQLPPVECLAKWLAVAAYQPNVTQPSEAAEQQILLQRALQQKLKVLE